MAATLESPVPSPRRRRAAPIAASAAVAAVLALAALAAAGALPLHATRTARAPAPRAYDGMLAGAPLQRANCASWRAAAPAQRGQAVRALSATIGAASTSGGVGTTLPDRDVSALFDRVCRTPGTSSFALYLIYARAAAFRNQRNGPTPITGPPAQQPGL
jgi:hypothetical protein